VDITLDLVQYWLIHCIEPRLSDWLSHAYDLSKIYNLDLAYSNFIPMRYKIIIKSY